MRVVNLRRSLICTRIARLQELSAVNHVLVKNRMIDEATESVEDVAAVHAADVGLEVGLDAEPRDVLLRLHEGLRRVVELPRILLVIGALLRRKLSAIDRTDRAAGMVFRYRVLIRVRLEDTHQPLDEGGILRHCVLGHHEKERRIRLRHAEVPARAVIELILPDMRHRDACILRNQRWIEE